MEATIGLRFAKARSLMIVSSDGRIAIGDRRTVRHGAPMDDPFNLQRFVDAQQSSYDAALAEVGRGQKRTHWMWFVLPQIAGLGSSAMAQRYAIGSLYEAKAYLAHPVLGARLMEIVGALQDLPAMQASDVFGYVDALKLRSSLTLFAAVNGPSILAAALLRWFGGEGDPVTLAKIEQL